MSLKQITYHTTDQPSRQDEATVDAGLHASNRATAEIQTIRPLACFARLASGELIGGAIGRTWGRCCELQQLWVLEEFRRRGVGRQLIAQFEAEAIRRGCGLVYLETLSFQAPSFYQRLGFETAYTFAGFPNGITKSIMRRTLADTGATDEPKVEL
jgi:GNAT superfamily N-acetyltransferase